MKVLIFSQYFWPEVFRINEVVDSLRLSGCEVTVLTGQPNYPDGRIFPGYRFWGIGLQKHCSGYSIYRVPLTPRGNGSAFQLITNYFSFIVTATVIGPWLLRGQKFDVIFVYAPSPILQAISAAWLAKVKKAKLAIWVQDLWPESLSATGHINNPKILKYIKTIVKWIYRKSDLLLVPSKAFVQPVKIMAGHSRVIYHPNPGNSTQIKHNASLPDIQLNSGFNVVFTGNLGYAQGLDTILAAAELLKSFEDITFVLVGSGSKLKWLHEALIRSDLTNIQLPGRFEPEAMSLIMDQASALLISLNRHPILSMTVPSKLQSYLAAGRPLIASLDGEGARVIREAKAGLVCPAEDPLALAQAVLQMRATSFEERESMGRSGLKFYLRNYDPALLSERLATTLREIIGPVKTGSFK